MVRSLLLPGGPCTPGAAALPLGHCPLQRWFTSGVSRLRAMLSQPRSSFSSSSSAPSSASNKKLLGPLWAACWGLCGPSLGTQLHGVTCAHGSTGVTGATDAGSRSISSRRFCPIVVPLPELTNFERFILGIRRNNLLMFIKVNRLPQFSQ